jgi:hypothetical protein
MASMASNSHELGHYHADFESDTMWKTTGYGHAVVCGLHSPYTVRLQAILVISGAVRAMSLLTVNFLYPTM